MLEILNYINYQKKDPAMPNAEPVTQSVESKVKSSYVDIILKTLPSSIVAGTVISYSTFPAEGYKKYLQSKQTEKFHWYRGSSLFALNIIPTTMIQFTVNGMLDKTMSKDPPIWQSLPASVLCGISAASTATVVENTIVRQQIMKCGPIDVLKDMYKVGGMTRLWKTYPLIATRDGIFTFNMFWALPKAQQYLTEKEYSPIVKSTANAGLAFFGAAVSHPFDTVATNLQKHHQNEKVMDAAKKIYLEGGYKAFFRGYLYRTFMFGVFSNVLPMVTKMVEEHIVEPLLNQREQSASESLNSALETAESGLSEEVKALPRLGGR